MGGVVPPAQDGLAFRSAEDVEASQRTLGCANRSRSSVLGTYSFDQNGDTTLTDYGVYKVGADGNPAFEKAIKAQAS